LKYLTENQFPRKIKQLHLVGTVLDEQDLPADDNYLGDFLFDISQIPALTKQVENIYIYHSKDDESCPYSHAERLKSYLPEAVLTTFTDRGHFRQSDFPELLENILKA
jgi:predicted alpha/beta hydrolase family esterase